MGGVESTQVTAGLAGFVVLFGLAVACWLLFRSMNNHLRKLRWRVEREERLAQEARDAEDAARGDASGTTAAHPADPGSPGGSRPSPDDGSGGDAAGRGRTD